MSAWVESLTPDQVLALAGDMANGSFLRQFTTALSADRLVSPRNRRSSRDRHHRRRRYTRCTCRCGRSRRLFGSAAVRSDLRPPQLHDVLQVDMRWTDSHLHPFVPDDQEHGPYFLIDADLEEGESGTPEDEERLDQVLRKPGYELRCD